MVYFLWFVIAIVYYLSALNIGVTWLLILCKCKCWELDIVVR